MTTEQILIYHARRYPLMRPTDAVKLLYQNEFGGGHLISDPDASLGWIEREYASIEKRPDEPLFEPIGNGIVRLNLAAVDTNALSLARVNELFVESSRLVAGSVESFAEKLDILRELVCNGRFSFCSKELAQYLYEYEKAGYPTVSHSAEYRAAYAPAYRVVLEKLFETVDCA